MFERTVTIGSAGKTLSATGWKLGWGIGPEHLIAPMQVLHQNCTYNCPTPVQVRNKCFYQKISMHDAWITVFQLFFYHIRPGMYLEIRNIVAVIKNVVFL